MSIRMQIKAVITVDKNPPINPKIVFCAMYVRAVIGIILFINATPSSFSPIMFMALNVQPINIAVTNVIAIKIDLKPPLRDCTGIIFFK